jgi:hypothetical protein
LIQIDKLAKLSGLKLLVLAENPISSLDGYRLEVLIKLPKLDKLDKEPVTFEEREEIEQTLELRKTKVTA